VARGADVLVRELVGGDPPYTCKVIFLDHPTGFGHRVVDGGRVVEHVLTRHAEFEAAVAAKLAEGVAETGRSLTRRVFVAGGMFWAVALDGDAVRTRFGKVRADWRESSGEGGEREYRDRDRAVAAYHRAVAAKEAEGYRELHPRPVVIPTPPKAPPKPGRRRAR
jgi:predicted DNA-binding WGR domain protein